MITEQLKTSEFAPVTLSPRLPYLAFRVNSLRGLAIALFASITLSLAALILIARTGAIISSNIASPFEPFALYGSIVPGRPSAALDEFRCQRAFDRNAAPSCSIFPKDGVFHLIGVTTRENVIAELSFFSESLQLGDLIHQWGDPDSMHRSENGRAITLVWDRGTHQFSATMTLRGTQPHVRVVTARINCDSANSSNCSQPP